MEPTERTISDAKRIIQALLIRTYDDNIMRILTKLLNYCDKEQLIIDISALDIAFTMLSKEDRT